MSAAGGQLDKEQAAADRDTDSCPPGRTRDSHLRETEFAENQCVIHNKIHYLRNQCCVH